MKRGFPPTATERLVQGAVGSGAARPHQRMSRAELSEGDSVAVRNSRE